MDIINPLVYPFEVSNSVEVHVQKMAEHPQKMRQFAEKLTNAPFKTKTHPRSISWLST